MGLKIDIVELKRIGAEYDISCLEITYLDNSGVDSKTTEVKIEVPEVGLDIHAKKTEPVIN